MSRIKVINHNILYENPFPQLRSRQGYFPSITFLDDGKVLVAFTIGEALESVDQASVVTKSLDGGRTWGGINPIYDKAGESVKISDYLKVTHVGNGKVVAFGYEYPRYNPDLPIGNTETGGTLKSKIIFFESLDEGETWSKVTFVPSQITEPIEASAPITVINNGSWVAPIANFFDWNGKCPFGLHGRLLRSEDCGKSWNDDVITMEFPGRETTIWEQRLCELENGNLIVIAWNEDLHAGKSLPNHFTISRDGGKSFSRPISTGIMGQASNLLHIGNNKVFALHCLRKNTNTPGIFGYIVDLKDGKWDIIDEKIIYEPEVLVKADKSMADVFAFLKFGQPSSIKLDDEHIIVVNWFVEDCNAKIACHRVKVEV